MDLFLDLLRAATVAPASLTFAAPVCGLLLLLLHDAPRGSFLLPHILFVRGLAGPASVPPKVGRSTGRAAQDLARWGLLSGDGSLHGLGVERALVLASATSAVQAAVIRDLDPDDPLGFFFSEVLAVAPGVEDRAHNLRIFLEVLKDSSGGGAAAAAEGTVDRTGEPSVSGSRIADLAGKIHALAAAPDDPRIQSLVCPELTLRPTVSLLPAQARVLWSVAPALLPRAISLESIGSYLAMAEGSSASSSELLNQVSGRNPPFLFGIYLGGTRARISLFSAPHPSAEGQRRALETYAQLLAVALSCVRRHSSVRPVVKGPSSGSGGENRKTFAASWIAPDSRNAFGILEFTAIVWHELRDAMQLVARPDSAFLDRVKQASRQG